MALFTLSLTECENLVDIYQSHTPAMNAHPHIGNREKRDII